MTTMRIPSCAVVLVAVLVMYAAPAAVAAQGRGRGADQTPAQGQAQRGGQGRAEQAPANAPALPLTPEQAAEAAARQQRAMLLRSFEQSTLSKANFGALKGLSEQALDALLTQARQERGTR